MPRLLVSQLEHEVRGEPLDVPLHSLNECARLDAVQRGQSFVKHDTVPMQDEGRAFDVVN